MKDYNVMIYAQNVLDQYDNIQMIASQGDEHITGCLLDYLYFKYCYKMTSINNSLMMIQKKYNISILLEI